MKRHDLLAVVERLSDTDVDILDRDELAGVVANAARVRGWLDALDLRCTRRGRTLADAGRAESAADLLAASSNRSSREAHQIARRGAVADAMPAFEDGLDNGSVSAGHLDAIANATRSAVPAVRAAFAVHEHELIALAATDTIDTFTRRCRTLVARLTSELTDDDASELDRQRAASHIRRWVTSTDGMHHTDISLDPLRDEIVWNAINRSLRSLQQRTSNARAPWAELQVEAFVGTLLGSPGAPAAATTAAQTTTTAAHSAPSPAADIAADLLAAIDASVTPGAAATGTLTASEDRAAPSALHPGITEVSVLIDLSTLTDGAHEHSVCETEDGTPLPVSTIRRLCCDAEIIPIVLGGHGETLDVGRARRTVNRAQRRALRAMHRTCAEPQCTVPYSHCKIHHIRWWWRDSGSTDIANLLPLCERHHHLVHEGGWTLTMTADRVATWTRPDGTIHHCGTTIDRQPTKRTSRRQPVAPNAHAGAG
jgi:hypothetical protein